MKRVGIANRRTVLHLDYIKETKNLNKLESFTVRQYTNAQMGASVILMVIDRAGITLDDIVLRVAGTSTPNNPAPAEASAIAAELDIEVPCFDLNSACR
jgi:3-oxoacyl-[acyl-carrier-protein] synthase-3